MRIIVAGDVCLAGEPEERFTASSANMWDGLRSCCDTGALLVANLEHPFTDGGSPRPFAWATLRAKPESLPLLRGLDVGVVANNHLGDYGHRAAEESVSRLASSGILPVGYGRTIRDAVRPLVVQRDGVQLAIVALCCPTTNGQYLATHLGPGVAPLGTETLRKAVTEARSCGDVVLVYMHWGCERVHDPVPDQVRLGRLAVDWGADAVVGCHSHTIQSYEQYQGRWVFYGLGNFVFGPVSFVDYMPSGETRGGVVRPTAASLESLSVEFSPDMHGGSTAGKLKLERIQAMRFDGSCPPQPVPIETLSFGLSASNERLARYGTKHRGWLQRTDEPDYVARFRHGVLVYSYSHPPITNADHPPLRTASLVRRVINRVNRR